MSSLGPISARYSSTWRKRDPRILASGVLYSKVSASGLCVQPMAMMPLLLVTRSISSTAFCGVEL